MRTLLLLCEGSVLLSGAFGLSSCMGRARAVRGLGARKLLAHGHAAVLALAVRCIILWRCFALCMCACLQRTISVDQKLCHSMH